MDFERRRQVVRERIEAACARCGRDPSGVELLAVSKRHAEAAIRDAWLSGQRTFGESRVQELVAKSKGLADLEGMEWQLIGSLQTNKVAALLQVPGLSLIHSLDRAKLADVIQLHAAELERRFDVLLQVAATDEASKHGVTVEDASKLAAHVAVSCPALRLRGVMAMGPREGDPAPVFERVAQLRSELAEQLAVDLPVLSLGMSGDLDAAVAAGTTLVRVGTALFGSR